MHALLNQAVRKADHVEVYALERKTLPVRFDAQGLSAVQTKQTAGVALRVIHEGRLGYATTTDLAHPDAVIEAAVATAAYGDPSEFEFPSEIPDLVTGIHEAPRESVSAEQLVDLGDAIKNALDAAGDDIESEISVQWIEDHVRIANSAGLDVEETVSRISVGIEAGRTRADDIYLVADTLQAGSLEQMTPETATRRVLKLLEMGKSIVPAPQGSLPVVFTPAGTVAVLLPLIMGLSGKLALLGLSPLKDKLGQRAFDERFMLADDGRAPGGSRIASFDDEGTASRRTSLILEGELENFYYDLRTAHLARVRSTGNGYKGGVIGDRNFRPAPSAAISHIVVGEGTASQDELIRDIKKGLLVDAVLGLGQGNLNAGDFSNNLSAAFLIEDGKIVGRVKNAMIAGNSYDLLRNHVIGFGNDSRWVYGRVHSPSIALDNVQVAAKG